MLGFVRITQLILMTIHQVDIHGGLSNLPSRCGRAGIWTQGAHVSES